MSGRTVARLLAAAAVIAVAVIAVVVSRGPGNPREFVSYAWQFYLPKLPFMNVHIGPDYGVRDVFVDRVWGAFAQLEVSPAHGLLTAIAWITVILAVATIVRLVTDRAIVARRWREALVLASAPLASIAVLHVTAYRTLVFDHSDPVIAGRYLLPFLPLAGIALALVLRRMPRPAIAGGVALAIGALALAQLVSLGLVFQRFYG